MRLCGLVFMLFPAFLSAQDDLRFLEIFHASSIPKTIMGNEVYPTYYAYDYFVEDSINVFVVVENVGTDTQTNVYFSLWGYGDPVIDTSNYITLNPSQIDTLIAGPLYADNGFGINLELHYDDELNEATPADNLIPQMSIGGSSCWAFHQFFADDNNYDTLSWEHGDDGFGNYDAFTVGNVFAYEDLIPTIGSAHIQVIDVVPSHFTTVGAVIYPMVFKYNDTTQTFDTLYDGSISDLHVVGSGIAYPGCTNCSETIILSNPVTSIMEGDILLVAIGYDGGPNRFAVGLSGYTSSHQGYWRNHTSFVWNTGFSQAPMVRIDACPLGVEEEDFESQLNVFPNPAQNSITFENPLPRDAGEIRVYNTVGELVLTTQTVRGQQTQTLDISFIPKGIYVLHYATAGQVWTERLVKH